MNVDPRNHQTLNSSLNNNARNARPSRKVPAFIHQSTYSSMRFLITACVAASAMPMTSSSPPSQGIRAQDVIDKLELKPHPEKGYYRETFQDPGTVTGNRSYSSAIYYFLEGKVGHAYWHRVDAAEVWYVHSLPHEPYYHNTKTGTTMLAHL
jgi:hypothetical protein